MINKCINCIKWITCKSISESRSNCKDFKFERIEIKEGGKNYEKKRKNY